MFQVHAATPKLFKDEVLKALLGSVILTRYNNKSYRIDEVDFDRTPEDSFPLSSGGTITYMEYYKRTYNIFIKDRNQPLIISKPKFKSLAEKKTDRVICLIPELCFLTGITEKMKNDFKVMREITSHTRLTPAQRQASLQKFVQSVHNSPEANDVLYSWGLELSKEPVILEGRKLDGELIYFAKNRVERVGPNVDWGRATTVLPALTAVSIDKWLLVFPMKNRTAAQSFDRVFRQQGPRIGIQIANPKIISLDNDRVESYLNAIRPELSPGVQLVVAIFPQERADRYAAFKKLCCIDSPVASQVILNKTLENERKLTSVVHKIALQINCKLGGELWASVSPYKGMMVVGIDVFHDPLLKGASIAGFVASTNATYSQWHSRVLVQKPNTELADALQIAFTDCLKAYHGKNNAWPRSVLVFRDGVGDDQLETCAKHEVPQLLECFKSCTSNPNPLFGFVVVQKRINTRLLDSNTGSLENPPPGTVIDHTITRKSWYDFFLVSQKVGLGTVSPSHYVSTVVYVCSREFAE
jgi:aubergine-like protein